MTPQPKLTPDEIRKLEAEFKEAEAAFVRKTDVYQKALSEHEALEAAARAASQKRQDAYDAVLEAARLKRYISNRLASANQQGGV